MSRPAARVRLFCFAYAGGGASAFRGWADEITAEVEVCPIQLPGRERRLREAPYTRLTPLILALADAIVPYLTIPFAFMGHSMGALISFELARQLRRRRAPQPLYLAVSGFRAPQLPATAAPLHQLADAELVRRLRSFNGTPEEILRNGELMRLVLPTLRADFAVCEMYQYTADAPLDCDLAVFGGAHDHATDHSALAAWQDQTTRSCTIRIMPGQHFFIHTARSLMIQAITQDLALMLSCKDEMLNSTAT